MSIDVNVLTAGWAIAGVIASLIIAAAAFIFGGLSLFWSNRISKKDRKERILRYIFDWSIEIHTTSLKHEIPYLSPMVELKIFEMGKPQQEKDRIAKNLLANQRRRSEGALSLLYAASFTRHKYVRELASQEFGKNWDMLPFIDKIIRNLFKIIYVGNKEIGMPDPKKGFSGKELEEWAQSIEDDFKKPRTTLDTLFIEYSTQLTLAVNNLHIGIAAAISNL